MTNEKELKRQLRALKRLKKDTQKASPARRDLNRQIRELKSQVNSIEETYKPDDEKLAVIEELTKLYESKRRPIIVDFRIYTTEQLKYHLTKVKGGSTLL